ncbi:MAG: RNA polymerase sigma factor [Polyangiaceae bacterium]
MGAGGRDQDFELLDRWQSGDAAAGNELFEGYFDDIYRFFSNKTTDPAELVQRTFLGCVEARDRFKRSSSFRTYVFSVARNVLYGHYREKRKGQLNVAISTMQDLNPTPSSLAHRKWEERLLLEALRSIPIEFQTTLELYYWQNLSGPELAEVLEIPLGTARSRVRRAREALAARVAELEGEPGRLGSTLAELDDWARGLRAALNEG